MCDRALFGGRNSHGNDGHEDLIAPGKTITVPSKAPPPSRGFVQLVQKSDKISRAEQPLSIPLIKKSGRKMHAKPSMSSTVVLKNSTMTDGLIKAQKLCIESLLSVEPSVTGEGGVDVGSTMREQLGIQVLSSPISSSENAAHKNDPTTTEKLSNERPLSSGPPMNEEAKEDGTSMVEQLGIERQWSSFTRASCKFSDILENGNFANDPSS